MEARIKQLEKTVQQQSYFIYAMLIIFPFLVAAILMLWGQQGLPDFDHIAVSLSVFQTFFGVAAFAGFWALRGLTKETAQDVAEAEIKKIAPSLGGVDKGDSQAW
ncbi:MAG: hypothetical protein JNL35_10460 [Sphingopyxis sp.]|nr:hypothetical protein [Sphingopyxis sp.]